MTKKEFQNALILGLLDIKKCWFRNRFFLFGHPNIYHLIIIFDKKVNGSF